LFGSPFGEGTAPCQNMNPVGDIHHQTHVVLDQHDRDSVLDDRAYHAIDFLRLDRIATGGRLVEQQQLRLAGQRARYFEALQGAIGERGGWTVGIIGKADAGKRRMRRFAVASFCRATDGKCISSAKIPVCS